MRNWRRCTGSSCQLPVDQSSAGHVQNHVLRITSLGTGLCSPDTSGGSPDRKEGRGVKPWSRQRSDPLRQRLCRCHLPLRGRQGNPLRLASLGTSPREAKGIRLASLGQRVRHWVVAAQRDRSLKRGERRRRAHSALETTPSAPDTGRDTRRRPPRRRRHRRSARSRHPP